MRRLCVYCGSNAGTDPAYREAAEAVGRQLAGLGVGLVYGGGRVGLMGAVADAALAVGGEVIGVIPQDLMDREVGHGGLTSLEVVGSMHERKLRMAELSDGFLALPGGIGTVEEIVEVFTWQQLRIHDKPCGLLDVAGYWKPFEAFLDHAVAAGFLREEHRAGLMVDADAERLLEAFGRWRPRATRKWVDP